jgi:FKBP-type peptidyl-prolyl cis-trans isomerase FkpA
MNNKFKIALIALMAVTAIVGTGCKKSMFPGYEQTDNGLYYKFHVQNPAGEKAEQGDILTVNMQYRNHPDSTAIFDSKQFELMYGQPWRLSLEKASFKGDIFEGLAMMGIGDSASFIVSTDSVIKYTPQSQGLDSGTMLFFDVKLLAIQKKAEFEKEQGIMMEKHRIMMDSLKINEESNLQKYLSENKINVKPTESGLYYIEVKKGSGAKPTAGQTVKVHYKGTMLDGNVFDTSEGREPIDFVIGTGQVIPGWDEGIMKMSIGGKAKFIIPSKLAYGENGAGPIPPYSPLVFEVELLNVK